MIRIPEMVAMELLEERTRQIEGENFSPEQDDIHTDWSLSGVAACYLLAITRRNIMPFWPMSFHKQWFKFNHNNPRRALVKAGALIIAEIERIDRKAERELLK